MVVGRGSGRRQWEIMVVKIGGGNGCSRNGSTSKRGGSSR